MTADPLDRLEAVVDAVASTLGTVRPEQWSAPTPCSRWDVRALVNHVVGGNLIFAKALSGDVTVEQTRDQLGRDVLGEDPLRAYRESATAVLTAFRRPGVLEGMARVPFGTVPGGVALHLRTVDVLVHGWDLAAALGRPLTVDAELVEPELAFSQQMLASMPALPRERAPFDPPVAVDPGAAALDRLAALLGRRVPWTPAVSS